ncbi:MAG: transcription antitermination factor NusB [Rikenellaceae bacterium]|nr:transcription antitermination factor NusB [Rikenellaceae bacterium]
MISRRMLRIKVIKTLYAHLKSDADSLMASQKTLVNSIDKTYDLYVLTLSLVAELAHYAEQRQELAKKKQLPTYEDLNPNRKFVDNRVVQLIANSDSVNDYLASRKLSWAAYPELVKTLYTQLEQTEYFQNYMSQQERSFKDDLALVTEFFTRELEECEMLEDVLDEMSILWNDDLGFALIMVLRTLSNVRPSHEEIKLVPKFKSEEDLDFACELFAKTAVNYDEYQQQIERFTRNWDVERIAFMDNLIMATAVAELVGFESIPVKVTLDEYIEIAKFYSTNSSGTFINGVLDKLVAALQQEGRINKSGRGLI